MSSNHFHIICSGKPEGRAKGELSLKINGVSRGVTLKVRELSEKLVSTLSDVALDLIEIASFVYAADAAVSRGGLADTKMGEKWRRSFHFDIPVRDPLHWNDPEIKTDLEKTLSFLSDDFYEFNFVQQTDLPETAGFFEFGRGDSWEPDSVVMFSGGLDSFAGAIEELVERKNKVALISHHSSTKIGRVQKHLSSELAKKVGASKLLHIPITVQLTKGTNNEGTHRTRSFLFAALGVITAQAFNKSNVSFYENGLVSLNIPPVSNVLGARATRTTHPKTLNVFSSLFSKVFSQSYKIDNPYFWRTKKEVVEVINRLNFADLIKDTRSCADVHNLTKMHTHCGRCSQCVDRRFAMMAAKLERFDPSEAYRVDLLLGERQSVTDKEVALSYVRLAKLYQVLTKDELLIKFPALVRVVGHLHEPADAALARLKELLARHGSYVLGVMDNAMSSGEYADAHASSLLKLHGKEVTDNAASMVSSADQSRQIKTEAFKLNLHFRADGKAVSVNGLFDLSGVSCTVLHTLAKGHLASAGKGLLLEDYELSPTKELMKEWNVGNEETVRRRVLRLRKALTTGLVSTGLEDAEQFEVIESFSWQGYRLNPDIVEVVFDQR